MGRNPLKSGQCFLLIVHKPKKFLDCVAIPSNRVNVSYKLTQLKKMVDAGVAIPSNRVNVSYLTHVHADNVYDALSRRNPLKSGQCFLQSAS